MMNDSFMFVYGTLRRSSGTHMSQMLARYSDYVGEAIMQGVLYEVDGYPGVIESNKPEDSVCGELFKILDENILLPLLDDYEECSEKFPRPHEYVRKVLPVTLEDGASVMAWVYIYNHDVTRLQRINL
jgi:gamma-glutamylcyclotransferase (GGCT)/AIG2-like uncharacterized protein YtfP